MDLSEKKWDKRYQNNDIGWDLGEISTPIKTYFDQLENKELKILIPGGGNSYEAEYLFKLGFKNVFVIDLSKTAIENIKKRVLNFPALQLIHGNFFELDNKFDLIIEQTFFCAINPELRPKYAEKTHELLTDKGKLVGLLFDAVLNEEHPPFGGSKNEYEEYFAPYFIGSMESCYNSSEGRQGMELFVKMTKK